MENLSTVKNPETHVQGCEVDIRFHPLNHTAFSLKHLLKYLHIIITDIY